jgi:hypothetical protein
LKIDLLFRALGAEIGADDDARQNLTRPQLQLCASAAEINGAHHERTDVTPAFLAWRKSCLRMGRIGCTGHPEGLVDLVQVALRLHPVACPLGSRGRGARPRNRDAVLGDACAAAAARSSSLRPSRPPRPARLGQGQSAHRAGSNRRRYQPGDRALLYLAHPYRPGHQPRRPRGWRRFREFLVTDNSPCPS